MNTDFLLIRKAVIILVVSLVSSVALVGTGRAFLRQQQDGMTQAQAELSDAFDKRHQAEKDKQKINDYQATYLQLRKRGFIGEEKRLDWIELVQRIRESRKLLPIAYEMSAQQVFQIDPAVSMGDLQLHGSKVQLQMGLLHELDLLNFLGDLSRTGFYIPQDCTLKRAAAVPINAQSPRLTAECTLYFLTLGEPAASQSQTIQPGKP
ncbi:hypothetical protein [Propionivibrio sp.]|uniref:hypothetical protein n=1 Tax=Propionivibrio sp. TaxID=2212460 RepID=UPI003BF16A3D